MKSFSSQRTFRWLVLLAAASIGCGSEDFKRHQVSGTVTYRGKAVEYGMLMFEPEATIGAVAPTSYAPVRDGVFESDPEGSPTTGTYKVRVLGFDRSNIPPDAVVEEMPHLFPEYVLTVEIPTPEGRLDIEVPDKPASGGSTR